MAPNRNALKERLYGQQHATAPSDTSMKVRHPALLSPEYNGLTRALITSCVSGWLSIIDLGLNTGHLLNYHTSPACSHHLSAINAPLWHPGLTTRQRCKIENIQRRATKIILGKNFTNYSSALKVLKLQTLEDRRVALCARFAKKVHNSDLYSHWLPEHRGNISGRVTRQNRKIDQVPARTDRYRKSSIPYFVTLLNNSV
ncbi:hypothetical protein Bbelb_229250 [Branchiostoma belcheri]|nr:hypothetical protein Bbelb_229250 [Branchiostoma belcheri]